MVYPLSHSLTTGIITSSEHQALLEHVSIHSVTDLFLLDYSKLKLIAQQTSIDFHKLIELRKFYGNLFLDDSYHLTNTHKSVNIRCSSDKLNSRIGGEHTQNIIEICGRLASGKSQLAWSFALESSMSGTRVIFVDVDLSVSKTRIMQLARLSKNFSDANFQSLMKSLFIVEVFDLENLTNLLELIVLNQTLHNSLLVIDSISSILFALNGIEGDINKKQLSKKRKLAKSELYQALKWATNKANLTTIVTRLGPNEQMPSWSSTDINISLDKDCDDYIKINVTDQTIFQSFYQFNDFAIQITDSGVIDRDQQI